MGTSAGMGDYAALAEAAYVHFDELETFTEADIARALKYANKGDFNGEFSETQAEGFVRHWRVVAHQPDTESGYSSTLFEDLEAPGTYVLALRGTEQKFQDLLVTDGLDIVVDGLAFEQILDLHNDWQRLTTPAGETYDAVYLEHLLEESIGYGLARAGSLVPGVGLSAEAYMEQLLARPDIVIDDPSGQVYALQLADSTTVFSDSRAVGAGVLADEKSLAAVTGHSLGGHLAAAFTRLFPELGVEAVTINGAGFATGAVGGLGGTAETNLRNLFTFLEGAAAFDPDRVLNLYGAAAPEFVTQNGPGLFQPGGHEPVYIESFSAGNLLGHGSGQMTDSLAVYDLFLALDGRPAAGEPAGALAALTSVLEGTDHRAYATLERAVNALGELLVEGWTAIPEADWGDGRDPAEREALHAAIATVRESPAYQADRGQAQIESLVGLDAETLVGLAQTDVAYRYALAHLSPFALVGDAALYAPHNAAGALDLYDPGTGTGCLSGEYLADRARMLEGLLARNCADSAVVPADLPWAGERIAFQDSGLGVDLRTASALGGLSGSPEPPAPEVRRYGFAGPAGGVLEGGLADDRLYGSTGRDLLAGGAGADYLEGGDGFDVLDGAGAGAGVDGYGDGAPDTLRGGQGLDVYFVGADDLVEDADGYGQVYFGAPLTGGVRAAGEGVYRSPNGGFAYALEGTTLTVTGPLGTLRVEGYHADRQDLGIVLQEAPATVRELALTPGNDQVRYVDDPWLPWVAPGVDPVPLSDYSVVRALEGDDRVFGSLLRPGQVIYGGDGHDELWCDARDFWGDRPADWGPGPDPSAPGGTLFGEAGVDVLVGSPRADRLAGGTQSDLAEGHFGDDQLAGDAGGDVLAGLADDDLLDGGPGEDWLLGGSGSDVLLGGEGDDVLKGDQHVRVLIAGSARATWSGPANGWVPVLAGAASLYSVQPGDGAATWTAPTTGGDQFVVAEARGTEAGNDLLDGGAGDDLLAGGEGADVLLGGDGRDLLEGEEGRDSLFGGAGNDVLHGDLNPSTYAQDAAVFASGVLPSGGAWTYRHRYHPGGPDVGDDDWLDGGAGDDELTGGAGGDALWGGTGQDLLIGDRVPADPDDPVTPGGNDSLDGGDGDDQLQGGPGDDLLAGGPGADVLIGDYVHADPFSQGVDRLDGGADNDTIAGGGAADDLIGGDGDDLIFGDDPRLIGYPPLDPALHGDDYVDAGAGNDRVFADGGDDHIFAGAGDDQVAAGTGADSVDGGDGADQIDGGAGDDDLEGGAGNDQLWGSEGHDGLAGGPGNDALFGGGGDDMYPFARGDGTDTAYDEGGSADRLVLGAGIRPGDVVLVQDAADLTVRVGPAGSRDAITFLGGLAGASTLETIAFADAAAWDSTAIAGAVSEYYLHDGERVAGNAEATTYHLARQLPSGFAITVADAGGVDALVSSYVPIDESYGQRAYLGGMHAEGPDLVLDIDMSSYVDRYDASGTLRVVDHSGAGRLEYLELANWTYATDAGALAHPGLYLNVPPWDEAGAFGFEWRRSDLYGFCFSRYLYVGTAGNDEQFLSKPAPSRMYGFEGDDRLVGNDDTDELHGGPGADFLVGKGDADTYHVDPAEADRVSDDARADTRLWRDTVRVPDGWSLASLEFARVGNDVYLGNTVILHFYERSSSGRTDYAIERLVGDTWAVEDLPAYLRGLGLTGEVEGTEGGERIDGEDTADTLRGHGGDDKLYGHGGADRLEGGEGADHLSGGEGNDHLEGGAGRDTLDGGPGLDMLVGGPGDDTYVVDEPGDGVMEGADEGNDTIETRVAIRLAENVEGLVLLGTSPIAGAGNPGANRLVGNGAANTLFGLGGDDTIDAAAGSDLVYGDDTVLGYAGVSFSDLIGGGVGDDTVYGQNGNDSLSGDEGNDFLFGGDQNDTLLGGSGNDFMQGDYNNDTLYGGTGNDTLNGGKHDDRVDDDGGNDRLLGDVGNDTLFGGDDNDTLDGGSNNDSLGGGNGNDSLLGGTGNDTLYGAEGNDRASGNSDKDCIVGGEGDDNLNGDQGADTIFGGTDLDRINGGSGNDLLWGGAGRDVIDAGSGADTVHAGLNEDLAYGLSGNDLILGGQGVDTIYGGSGDDTLAGGTGRDWLHGEDDCDWLEGGPGRDWLDGGGGADTLVGGEGDDTLVGGAGPLEVPGLDGDTFVYRFGWTDGMGVPSGGGVLAPGNDHVVDLVPGLAAGDTLVLRPEVLEGPAPTLESLAEWVAVDRFDGDGDGVADGTRIAFLRPGMTPGEADPYAQGLYLWGVLPSGGTGGAPATLLALAEHLRITVDASGFAPPPATSLTEPTEPIDPFTRDVDGNGAADYLEGSPGGVVAGVAMVEGSVPVTLPYPLEGAAWRTGLQVVWARDAWTGTLDRDRIVAAGGNDQIAAGSGADSLLGGAGNDTILGEANDDLLLGEAGQDVLEGGTGRDWLLGGAGDDRLAGGYGEDTLAGEAGRDTLDGGAGEDLLDGGADPDEADGGEGNDTMLGGDGADTLRGGGDDDHLAGGAGADLLFGDSVDTAGSGEDTLLGGEGADTLRGDGGDDWLEGGPGDDVLDGGPGDDLYVFGRGDGADTLSGIGAAPDDWDRLQFGAGIGADQLWLRRVAADLEVSVIGTADRLTLPGWFGETPGAIEEIALDSGGRLLASRVQVLVDAMAAFSPPPSGQVTLPDSYRESLDPVIAASWG